MQRTIRVTVVLVVAALVTVGLAVAGPGVAGASRGARPVKLVTRTGADGITVLVPANFTFKVTQFATGAESAWSDPKHRDRSVTVSTGVEVGGWFEVDGVAGSITPLLPKDAKVSRVSADQFEYQLPTTKQGNAVRGLWVASLDEHGSPLGYLDLRVTLPRTQQRQATRIIDAFSQNPADTSLAP